MGGRCVGSQGLEETPRTLLNRPSENISDKSNRRCHRDFLDGGNVLHDERLGDTQSPSPHDVGEMEADFSCSEICHMPIDGYNGTDNRLR
jgi:hypothetical protein